MHLLLWTLAGSSGTSLGLGIVDSRWPPFIETKSILKNRHVWWKLRPHLDYKTLEFRLCDAQRSLENVRILSSLCRALAYKSFIEYKDGNLFENLSVDFLNDSLWKASRFGFDSLIYDEVSDRVLTIRESIILMYEYCYDELVTKKSLNPQKNHLFLWNICEYIWIYSIQKNLIFDFGQRIWM